MQVSADKSPLYTRGNRTRQYVQLGFCSSLNTKIAEERVKITYGAVNQIGGVARIVRLLPEGVELEGGKRVALPAIRVRTIGEDNDPDPTTFLISKLQEEWLQSVFGLPPDVMAGAFFRITRSDKSNPVYIAPHWPELVTPEWGKAFAGLVRDPAHHPVPLLNCFPWTSLISQELVLPCVWNKVPYPYGKTKGELRIVVVDGAPLAIFARPGREADPATYLLRWIKEKGIIVAEYQQSVPVQEPAAAPGAFDGCAFATLFAPGDKSVLLCQKAGVRGFSFCPEPADEQPRTEKYHPESLELRFPSKFALEPGTDGFFTAFRCELASGSALFMVLFKEEARQNRLGWARYNFDRDGFVRIRTNSLRTDEYPDDLRGLLEGNK